jgi:hypothetical protein
MPLNRRVSFKTTLQKQNRLQVPKLIRWEYKLEPNEVLRVTVNEVVSWGLKETFLAKMYESGRIRIPNLTIAILKRDKPTLEGYTMQVTLEPV